MTESSSSQVLSPTQALSPTQVLSPNALRGAALVCLLLVMATDLLLQGFRMFYVYEWGDEGFFANGALRVLQGEVIYRDFQHNYPPGRVFSLALLLATFGHQLVVVRVFWVGLHVVAVGVGFLVARRLMPLGFAFAAALGICLNVAPLNKSLELAAATLVLFALARGMEARGRDLEVGCWIGLAGFFRQDLGVAALGLYVVCLGLQVLGDGSADSLERRFVARIRRAWPFVVGWGFTAVPLLIYLGITGSIRAALEDLLLSGFLGNLAMARPFPSLVDEWSLMGFGHALTTRAPLFYVPPLLYAVGGAIAVARLRRSRRDLSAALVLLTSLLGFALFLQVLPRSDWGHLQKAYIPAHLVAFALLAQLGRWFRDRKSRREPAWADLSKSLPAFILIGFAILSQWSHNWTSPQSAWTFWKTRDRARVVELPHGDLWMPAQRANSLRPLMERIIRESANHEASRDLRLLTFPSGSLFNFLLGIRSPLPFDVLRPGELRNNDPKRVGLVLDTLEREKPAFLLHLKEGSNQELSRKIHLQALRDYEYIRSNRVDLYIRR